MEAKEVEIEMVKKRSVRNWGWIRIALIVDVGDWKTRNVVISTFGCIAMSI